MGDVKTRLGVRKDGDEGILVGWSFQMERFMGAKAIGGQHPEDPLPLGPIAKVVDPGNDCFVAGERTLCYRHRAVGRSLPQPQHVRPLQVSQASLNQFDGGVAARQVVPLLGVLFLNPGQDGFSRGISLPLLKGVEVRAEGRGAA